MPEKLLGKFIVFEGGEGSGKSTQAKLLYEALKKEGRDVLLTKEPGGDESVCKDIRSLLLNPEYKNKMSPRTELLLFEADRAQHIDTVIRPALEEGRIVISDRFEASTFAYQCGGRGLNCEQFAAINEFAAQSLIPNFTFLLDIDPKIGLQRNINAAKRDRFEMEDLDFHNRVRTGFLRYFETVARGQGKWWNRWRKLDGSLSIEELHKQVVDTLKNDQLI